MNPTETTPASNPEPASERQKLKHLFNEWTNHPFSEARFGKLKAAMTDFELKARLRVCLPSSPL